MATLLLPKQALYQAELRPVARKTMGFWGDLQGRVWRGDGRSGDLAQGRSLPSRREVAVAVGLEEPLDVVQGGAYAP